VDSCADYLFSSIARYSDCIHGRISIGTLYLHALLAVFEFVISVTEKGQGVIAGAFHTLSYISTNPEVLFGNLGRR
jgi:hypothetical protein